MSRASGEGRTPGSTGFRSNEEGASALEFALIFPVLVTLMFGVVAIGQAFYMAASAQWAVERSVRQIMINSLATGDEVVAEVQRTVRELSGLEVEVSYEEDSSGPLPLGRVFADVRLPVSVPFVTTFHVNYSIESFAPRPFAP